MPTVEIITIGTELLLGDVQDTNTWFIAKNLKETGYDLFRISTIGDNENRIASLLNEAILRSDVIITTGGLGPTVDDPTREAVAKAFDRKLVFHEELWQQINTRFQTRGLKPTDNNRKQALIPEGATAIENKYGTAPGFILTVNSKYIVCLQGVPQEMEHLFIEDVLPFLKKTIPPVNCMVTKTLHTIGIGESTLDTLVGDFEKLENPTVGLLAHSGQVDIRIVASALTKTKANQMVNELESRIRDLVSGFIYGEDEENIEIIISQLAKESNKKVSVYLVNFPQIFMIEIPYIHFISKETGFTQSLVDDEIVFTCPISTSEITNRITINSQRQSKIVRTHLGTPQSFNDWARNLVFFYIWMELKVLQ